MTTFTDLSHTLNGWINWLRLQRAVRWSLRGLIGGLALALVIAVIGMFEARLLRGEFILLVVATLIFGPVLAAAVAYLWPVQPLKAARYFDRVFHLNERVSTALELRHVKGPNQPVELIQKQLTDAAQAARTVRPHKDLPLKLSLREELVALIFVVLLGLSWVQGDAMFQKAQETRAVQQVVNEQTKKIEEILSNVQNNNALTEEQKKALSEPLQQALNELKDNPTKEGAVSALTSAGEKLDALTSPEAEKMAQALKEAGNQAAAQKDSPLQAAGEKLAQGNTTGAASELAEMDVSKLSPAQSEQLAGQLDTMADSVAETNPQLAQNLKDAAQALKDGDTAKAQQALNEAAQSMAQAGQQTAQSQVAGQTAQQMQQGAGQVMASGGGQQPGQGQTAQNGNPPQNGQPGQGQQMPGTGNQPGNGTGQQGQGSSQNGQGQGGASDNPNGPGDGGETTYEQIYAPSLLGGKDGTTLNLPTTGGQGGDVIGSGPSQPGDPGASLVPYTDVYQQYDQSNHQAIENGEIPFEFLQAIRNYFDALKP